MEHVIKQAQKNKQSSKDSEAHFEEQLENAVKLIAEVNSLEETRVIKAWKAGKIFADIKSQKRGTYGKWLKTAADRIGFSFETANRYRKIAEVFSSEEEIEEVAHHGLTKVYDLADEARRKAKGKTNPDDQSTPDPANPKKVNKLHQGLKTLGSTMTKIKGLVNDTPPDTWGASDRSRFMEIYKEMRDIADRLAEQPLKEVDLNHMRLTDDENEEQEAPVEAASGSSNSNSNSDE